MRNSEHASRGHSGVSRREFLKGSGAAAAATALAVGPEQVAEAQAQKKPRAFASGPATIILQVNTHISPGSIFPLPFVSPLTYMMFAAGHLSSVTTSAYGVATTPTGYVTV